MQVCSGKQSKALHIMSQGRIEQRYSVRLKFSAFFRFAHERFSTSFGSQSFEQTQVSVILHIPNSSNYHAPAPPPGKRARGPDMPSEPAPPRDLEGEGWSCSLTVAWDLCVPLRVVGSVSPWQRVSGGSGLIETIVPGGNCWRRPPSSREGGGLGAGGFHTIVAWGQHAILASFPRKRALTVHGDLPQQHRLWH